MVRFDCLDILLLVKHLNVFQLCFQMFILDTQYIWTELEDISKDVTKMKLDACVKAFESHFLRCLSLEFTAKGLYFSTCKYSSIIFIIYDFISFYSCQNHDCIKRTSSITPRTTRTESSIAIVWAEGTEESKRQYEFCVNHRECPQKASS